MENNGNKELYHTLKRLNRLMHRLGHHGPGEHGLHRGQVYLLKTIQQNEGIIQRDLADLIDIRPSSLTEALLRMEQEGLAERKQDERDQRLMHIYLTDLGGQALEALDESDDPFNDSLLSCLTAEESASMVTLCNKLCDSLEGGARDEEEKCHHGRRGRHCHDECKHEHHGEEHHGECRHEHHGEEHHGECRHEHHGEEHHGECKHEHHGEEHHGECKHEHHGEEHHGECRHEHHGEEHHGECKHEHHGEEHHGECRHEHHGEEHHGECKHEHHGEENHGECKHEHHDEDHHGHHRHHGQPETTDAASPSPDAGTPA
jgi:DNA-binding MarR family transcriptional regulator